MTANRQGLQQLLRMHGLIDGDGGSGDDALFFKNRRLYVDASAGVHFINGWKADNAPTGSGQVGDSIILTPGLGDGVAPNGKVQMNGAAAVTGPASIGGLLSTAGISAVGRIQGFQGDDVVSASHLTLGVGNLFNVSGTTRIDLLDSTGWQSGAQVTLLFSGILHVTAVAVPSGAFLPIALAGTVDFVTTSGCTLTLVFEANGWWEIGRMVP